MRRVRSAVTPPRSRRPTIADALASVRTLLDDDGDQDRCLERLLERYATTALSDDAFGRCLQRAADAILDEELPPGSHSAGAYLAILDDLLDAADPIGIGGAVDNPTQG